MLKLQYFGHLMRKVDSFEKNLKLRKIESRRKTGDIQNDDELFGLHHDSMSRNSAEQVSLAWCSPWGRKELDMAERLNNITKIDFN